MVGRSVRAFKLRCISGSVDFSTFVESLDCTSSLYSCHSLFSNIVTRCFDCIYTERLGIPRIPLYWSRQGSTMCTTTKLHCTSSFWLLYQGFLVVCMPTLHHAQGSSHPFHRILAMSGKDMLWIQLSRSTTTHRHRLQSILRLEPLYQVAMISGYSFQDWICCPRDS
jgi:hypothetical protein